MSTEKARKSREIDPKNENHFVDMYEMVQNKARIVVTPSRQSDHFFQMVKMGFNGEGINPVTNE